jgi:hypothetical protein
MTAPVSDAGGGFRRNIRREIRKQFDGIDLAADVNAVVAVNTGSAGESGKTTVSRSVHRTAVSQPQRGRPADRSRATDDSGAAPSDVTEQTGEPT